MKLCCFTTPDKKRDKKNAGGCLAMKWHSWLYSLKQFRISSRSVSTWHPVTDKLTKCEASMPPTLWRELTDQNIFKCTLTNKLGNTLMSTCSITVKTAFVVISNLQGRSINALSQYRTCPKFPSTDVGRFSFGIWNWNGKLYSPGASTGFSPAWSGAKKKL